MRGMDRFDGRTAIVTGGASGIGRGLAERFVAEGMNVVVADIEEAPLKRTADEIGALAVQVDVSDLASMEKLRDATLAHFGSIDIVCNNAGIGAFSRVADLTMDDWRWIISVNLWGVIHGVQIFLPILLGNERGGWMVNTASMGGVSTFPTLGAYATTKFGVAALTETLFMEMEQEGSNVGVTLLLPGPIRSNLGNSSRNRPASLQPGALSDGKLEQMPQYRDSLPWKDPAHAAEVVMAAIRNGELYAVTHPEQFERVASRSEALLNAFGKSAQISDI